MPDASAPTPPSAPPVAPRRRRRSRKDPRGIALMLVLISIAILTVLATDFAYNSRVDLQLATNQRDEVRAYYLAQSGIGLARLVLKFQKQVDNIQIPNPASLLSLLGGAAGGAAGQQAAQPSNLNLQLWRMAKVDCHMLQQMVNSETNALGDTGTLRASSGGRARATSRSAPSSSKFDFDQEFPEEAGKQAKRTFGGFEGCFQATISDEEEKINLSRLDAPQLSSQPTVMTLLTLFADKRFEFLFEREDSNRVKVLPQDVVVNLKDWVDEDEVQSTLNLSGQGDIFLKGFSDENYNYDRYNPRYKAKNARFDSLDEVYMVHGVNDRFMAAFRDRLTVYPDVNRNININTDDPVLLYMAILAVADPAHPDPRLQNPLFIEQLITQIRTARMFSFFGMGVQDFMNIVATAGVPVNQAIKNNVQNNRWVSDKSQTFRISSVGEAGSVKKTLSAVVRLDDGLGKLLYWREE